MGAGVVWVGRVWRGWGWGGSNAQGGNSGHVQYCIEQVCMIKSEKHTGGLDIHVCHCGYHLAAELKLVCIRCPHRTAHHAATWTRHRAGVVWREPAPAHGCDVGHKGGVDACGGRVCIRHHHHLLLLLVCQSKLGQQGIQVILITWAGFDVGAWRWCRGEG